MSELLSCPFCGAPGVRTLVGHADIQYFHCDERTQGCGAVISFLLRKIGSSEFAAWNRRASPSVGGVRVPDELPIPTGDPENVGDWQDNGYACGFNNCRDEVLRLNPAAEVGEVEALERWGMPDHPRKDTLLIRRDDGYWTPWHIADALLRRLAGSGKEMNR